MLGGYYINAYNQIDNNYTNYIDYNKVKEQLKTKSYDEVISELVKLHNQTFTYFVGSQASAPPAAVFFTGSLFDGPDESVDETTLSIPFAANPPGVL